MTFLKAERRQSLLPLAIQSECARCSMRFSTGGLSDLYRTRLSTRWRSVAKR